MPDVTKICFAADADTIKKIRQHTDKVTQLEALIEYYTQKEATEQQTSASPDGDVVQRAVDFGEISPHGLGETSPALTDDADEPSAGKTTAAVSEEVAPELRIIAEGTGHRDRLAAPAQAEPTPMFTADDVSNPSQRARPGPVYPIVDPVVRARWADRFAEAREVLESLPEAKREQLLEQAAQLMSGLHQPPPFDRAGAAKGSPEAEYAALFDDMAALIAARVHSEPRPDSLEGWPASLLSEELRTEFGTRAVAGLPGGMWTASHSTAASSRFNREHGERQTAASSSRQGQQSSSLAPFDPSLSYGKMRPDIETEWILDRNLGHGDKPAQLGPLALTAERLHVTTTRTAGPARSELSREDVGLDDVQTQIPVSPQAAPVAHGPVPHTTAPTGTSLPHTADGGVHAWQAALAQKPGEVTDPASGHIPRGLGAQGAVRPHEGLRSAYGWLEEVNPYREQGSGFVTNCVLTAIAVDLSLRDGGVHQAPPSDPGAVRQGVGATSGLRNYLENYLDRVPDPVSGVEAVVAAMSAAPVGARGMVVIEGAAGGVDHVVNVTRDHNGVVFLDGQVGAQVHEPDGVVSFLPTTEGIPGHPLHSDSLTVTDGVPERLLGADRSTAEVLEYFTSKNVEVSSGSAYLSWMPFRGSHPTITFSNRIGRLTAASEINWRTLQVSEKTEDQLRYRSSDELLFRWERNRGTSSTGYQEIFENGFTPQGQNLISLKSHVFDHYPSVFVSTTRLPNAQHHGWGTDVRYLIDAPGGIDVKESLPNGLSGEGEVAFPGGIRNHFIVGAEIVNGISLDESTGTYESRVVFIANPHYFPRHRIRPIGLREVIAPNGEQWASPHAWSRLRQETETSMSGIYRDSANQLVHVREAQSADHARSEVLASELYQAAGIDAPRLTLVTINGRYGTASIALPGAEMDARDWLQDAAYRSRIRSGFAVDAWLANWDVKIESWKSRPVRVNFDGALLFQSTETSRGSGSGAQAPEWEERANRDNLVSVEIFINSSPREMRESARRLLDVPDSLIEHLVFSVGFTPAKAQNLKTLLLERKRSIVRSFTPRPQGRRLHVANSSQSVERPHRFEGQRTSDQNDRFVRMAITSDSSIEGLLTSLQTSVLLPEQRAVLFRQLTTFTSVMKEGQRTAYENLPEWKTLTETDRNTVPTGEVTQEDSFVRAGGPSQTEHLTRPASPVSVQPAAPELTAFLEAPRNAPPVESRLAGSAFHAPLARTEPGAEASASLDPVMVTRSEPTALVDEPTVADRMAALRDSLRPDLVHSVRPWEGFLAEEATRLRSDILKESGSRSIVFGDWYEAPVWVLKMHDTDSLSWFDRHLQPLPDGPAFAHGPVASIDISRVGQLTGPSLLALMDLDEKAIEATKLAFCDTNLGYEFANLFSKPVPW